MRLKAATKERARRARDSTRVRDADGGREPFQGRLPSRIIRWNPRSHACARARSPLATWNTEGVPKRRAKASLRHTPALSLFFSLSIYLPLFLKYGLHRGRPDERERTTARKFTLLPFFYPFFYTFLSSNIRVRWMRLTTIPFCYFISSILQWNPRSSKFKLICANILRSRARFFTNTSPFEILEFKFSNIFYHRIVSWEEKNVRAITWYRFKYLEKFVDTEIPR